MPLYEYRCPTCATTFEALRPAAEADLALACPSCDHATSQRILSLFATSVKTGGADRPAPVMAGGCCGGACGCHGSHN
jgi:putative FmdB family regulatory protein